MTCECLFETEDSVHKSIRFEKKTLRSSSYLFVHNFNCVALMDALKPTCSQQ